MLKNKFKMKLSSLIKILKLLMHIGNKEENYNHFYKRRLERLNSD